MPSKGKTENFNPERQGSAENLSGCPKSKALSQAYRSLLEQEVPGDPKGHTWAVLIAEARAREAAKGGTPAAREIAARTEVRAPQAFLVD